MEVEVKFRITDVEEIERKISTFAEFVVEKVEDDVYFNHPCRNFAETDEALRIRKDSDGFTLTYKGSKIDPETKTRDEIKLKIDDFDKMREILIRLGFRISGRVVKKRKIYKNGEVTICIDWLEGLGNFVEIEIESADIDKAKKKIFEYAKRLGLEKENSIRKSYLEMILDVADNNGER